MTDASTVGFIGLGSMGGQLAANLVGAGRTVVAYDVAGPERCPDGATFAASTDEVARTATVVVCSLPDGLIAQEVARTLAGVSADERTVTHVVDTSTVGLSSAHTIDTLLAEAGIAYVDAPVSGGVAGARARTLSVMYAGTDDACAAVEPVLADLSDRRRRVGDRPGMAQALKLANNFLSATALAAASEAVSFGVSVGLDMETMLEVLNSSSGQSAATSDKFVNHVLTGTYSSGFANSLMAKDVRLYLQAVDEHYGPSAVARLTAGIWEQFARADPGVDFTNIYRFVDGNTDQA